MNENLIELCARLSVCAYSGEAPGYDTTEIDSIHLPESDTMLRVYTQDNRLIFAFRGTVSKLNWKTNLTARKMKLGGTDHEFHAGYVEVAHNLFDKVFGHIIGNTEQPHVLKELVFTGHSMGGALAVIMAVMFAADFDTLITFGQPRVASAATLKATLNCKYIRVVNGSDGVTQVPKLGYGHTGTLLYLCNDGRKLIDPGVCERGIDMMKDWLHESVTDHWMGKYYDLVRSSK